MAMRALSLIRKTCHIDSYTSSIKHSISSIASRYASRKEISSTSTLMSSTHKSLGSGIPWRSLSACSSGLGSIVGQSHYQSSLQLGCAQRSYSTSGGMVPNMRLRFQKQRRNRGDIKGAVDNHISFGKYGLETLEQAWITTKQITAGQLAIKRNMKGGKLFLRVFPHKPISLKPAETRMGRGKGGVAFWVASVKAGRILFEIDGVPESVARRAIAVAASKMPIKTRFVKSLG